MRERGGRGGRGKGKKRGEGKGRDPQGLVDTPHVPNPEKYPAEMDRDIRTDQDLGQRQMYWTCPLAGVDDLTKSDENRLIYCMGKASNCRKMPHRVMLRKVEK